MADGLSGDSDDHGAIRNLFHHNGISADSAVVTDFDRAEDFRAGADDHPVSDRRVTLAGLWTGSAERDAVVDRDVVTDLRSLADHHTRRVVDEQTRPDDGTGVDVDPGQDPVISPSVRAATFAPRPHSQWLTRWPQMACTPG